MPESRSAQIKDDLKKEWKIEGGNYVRNIEVKKKETAAVHRRGTDVRGSYWPVYSFA